MQRRRQGSCIAALFALAAAAALPCKATAQDEAAVVVAVPRDLGGPAPLRLTGSVTAERRASLSPRTSGLVAAVLVDAGDQVAAGDALLALDPALAEQALARARAALAEARVRLAEAERLLGEARALGDVVAKTQMASRAAEVRIQRAQVERLRAEEQEQAERVARHQLAAPFTGVITRKLAEVGEWVETGTPVLELLATDRLRLDVQMPQEHYAAVAADTPVTVLLDPIPDHAFTGRVVAVVPQSDATARTFLVRVVLDDPRHEVIAGMSGEAAFALTGAGRALEVPRDAVVRGPDGSTDVWVVEGDDERLRASRRGVRLGRPNGDRIEVVDGLAPGVRVVVRGNEGLREGQAVRIVADGQRPGRRAERAMIEAAIRNGTQLAVAVLVLCVLGVVAALRVPVQMIPDLEVRTISVRTLWPGATPQDVEQEIVIEQEEVLRNIPNLQRMTSTATTGEAVIELEFPFGIDIDDAFIRVSNALSQVQEYPENVDEPRLLASSFSENSFMYFRVEPLPGHPIADDMDRMQDFIDDYVRTRMERVPGISQVQIRGGTERQIQVRVDPGRLAATGVSLVALRDTIRARNRDVSAGDLESGKRRYLLRTVGRFRDLRDIEQLIVARRGDALVRLRDVASVELGAFEPRAQSFVNGRPAVNLSVRRETGSNVIEIKRRLMPVVAEINEQVLEPVGLQMALTSDDVRYVEASIRNVWKNLAIGAMLATGVLFLFLRSVPATFCGVIGIPICTIAAFLGLLLAGRTINVISLAGVAFAIGMTLDNGIVVLENIERERRRGRPPLEASLAGVRGVWTAVLASTITTVLVFAPVLFVREEAGQLFSDIAIAISASILVSMAVAVTVVPAAAARARLGDERAGAGRLREWTVAALGWLVATRERRLAGVLGPVAAVVAILLLLTPPAEYLPEGEEAKIFAQMIAPPGYNVSEMVAIAERLQADLVSEVEAEPDRFANGETDVPPLAWINVIVSAERVFIVSEPLDAVHLDALVDALTARFREIPGMRAFAARGSIITSNDGGTRSVNLDIGGPELADIYRTAAAAYRGARELFDEPQIGSAPSSLTLGQPLIQVEPEWARVAELGFTAEEFGFTVSALTDGAFVDEVLLAGDKVDLFVYGDGRDGNGSALTGLADLPLLAPRGAVVPVGAVARLAETVDTDTIRRVDGRRTVTLNVIPPRSVALETAVERVEQELVPQLRARGLVPAGVSVEISGASDQLDATRASLGANFGVSLLLCYLVLVAIFTHWGYPLVIMTTVPLGIAGGVAGLAILNAAGGLLPWVGVPAIHQPFDMITMLGFLILLGTVVNNPILIVDRALRNVRDEGMELAAAVQEAVDSRLRPMMMTTITTVFGLAPLVFLPGAGTELYRGVGAIVLFGLLFATLVTIVFLPSLLATILEARTWLHARRG